jgi:hypothetical protein
MLTFAEVVTMPAFPPGAHQKGGQASAPVNRELAREFYEPIIPIVLELRRQGLSLRQIARELDRRGIRTRQVGKYESFGSDMEIIRWSAQQVRRVLARAAEGSGPADAPGELAQQNLADDDIPGEAETPTKTNIPAVTQSPAPPKDVAPEERLQRHGYRLACRLASGSDLWHVPQGGIVTIAEALARREAAGLV